MTQEALRLQQAQERTAHWRRWGPYSYMEYLYKYPQAAFPYGQLVDENRQRHRHHLEYELLDTRVFNEDRNGAGIGASHQTGWTALVAKLLQQNGE